MAKNNARVQRRNTNTPHQNKLQLFTFWFHIWSCSLLILNCPKEQSFFQFRLIQFSLWEYWYSWPERQRQCLFLGQTLGYQGWYKARLWFSHLQSILSFRAKYVKPDPLRLHKHMSRLFNVDLKHPTLNSAQNGWAGAGLAIDYPNRKFEKWFSATKTHNWSIVFSERSL